MTRPATLDDSAIAGAYAFQRGALSELERDVEETAAATTAVKVEADKATADLQKLSELEQANRDERAALRTAHAKANVEDLKTWSTGGKVDTAKSSARSAGQLSQIVWLTSRADFATNVARPKLQLAQFRRDVTFAVCAADAPFAQATVAAYHRHEAMQRSVEVDGVAQVPVSEGRANKLWREATALMGRAGEIAGIADHLDQQIQIRENNQ